MQISSVNGLPLVIKGEPRGSIISFLVGTLWVCFQIEWITELHTRNIHFNNEQAEFQDARVLCALRFRTASNSVKSCRSPALAQLTIGFMLALTIALFLGGSLTEVIRFTSSLDNSSVCIKSYNWYSLGTELVAAFLLQGNSVKPQEWTLYMTYIFLVIVFPLLVHTVHCLVLILDAKTSLLCRLADVGWTFASAEVLVIALLVLQVRFPCFMR